MHVCMYVSRSGHAATPLACLEKWSLSAEVDFKHTWAMLFPKLV